MNPATYRIYIAPLIFCLAPVINTLLSLVWHPKPGDPWHFGVRAAGVEAAGRHPARRGRHVPGAVLEGRGRGVEEGGRRSPRRPPPSRRHPAPRNPPVTSMTPEEAVARLNTVLAHAWMVRTFLKHADEIQENEEMLDVPRTLYDSIRAVEPAFQRGDLARLPPPAEGQAAEAPPRGGVLRGHFKEFSPHTNFEMAAAVLHGCGEADGRDLRRGGLGRGQSALARPETGPRDPLDDIEIPRCDGVQSCSAGSEALAGCDKSRVRAISVGTVDTRPILPNHRCIPANDPVEARTSPGNLRTLPEVTMETVFIICAILGGTLVVCQVAAGLVGFGAETMRTSTTITAATPTTATASSACCRSGRSHRRCSSSGSAGMTALYLRSGGADRVRHRGRGGTGHALCRGDHDEDRSRSSSTTARPASSAARPDRHRLPPRPRREGRHRQGPPDVAEPHRRVPGGDGRGRIADRARQFASSRW